MVLIFGTFNPSADWVDVPYKDMFTEFYPNFQTIKESTGGTGYIYAWASILRVGVMLRVADIYGLSLTLKWEKENSKWHMTM